MSNTQILTGDCMAILPTLEAESVQCCVTSPPYWGLRDYGTASWEGGEAGCDHKTLSGRGQRVEIPDLNASTLALPEVCSHCGARRIDSQLGLESTPEEYVAKMVGVFREVWRVLRDDGTLWLNLGDSYAGGAGGRGDINHRADGAPGGMSSKHNGERIKKPIGDLKPKDLVGIPWRLAFALQADGWYLRSDIIWHKPNPMPESVTDRPTKSHEYIFLLTKSERYFYDADAIREPVQYDPRDELWGKTECTSFNNHSEDLTKGMMQQKPEGFVHMSNPLGRNKRTVWTVATQPYGDVSLNFDEADYVGRDGKPYRASADCPIHGHLVNRRTQQMAEGGEQLDRQGLRSLDTDARRAAKLVAERVAILSRTNGRTVDENISEHKIGNTILSKTHNGRSNENLICGDDDSLHTNHIESLSTLPACNLDSSQTGNEGSAILNNNQSRKTDHVPETTSPCNVSVERTSRIDDKSKLPETGELFAHTPENNTLLVDSGVHPSAQKQTDILGKPSLRDNICQCKEYSQSHFATFPEDLIKPCILAGSRLGDTVLDPFAGSGTTGKVALELGRKAILIELNPDYIKLARKRTFVTPGFL